jgi:hypothetical protein
MSVLLDRGLFALHRLVDGKSGTIEPTNNRSLRDSQHLSRFSLTHAAVPHELERFTLISRYQSVGASG